MKTIIAGSRIIPVETDNQEEFDRLQKELFSKELLDALDDIDFEISEVVCGMAKGADLTGKAWAEENNIIVKEFPAKWKQFGKSAGPQRNIEMARYAESLIALWDGASTGTRHMIRVARMQGLKVHIHYIK